MYACNFVSEVVGIAIGAVHYCGMGMSCLFCSLNGLGVVCTGHINENLLLAGLAYYIYIAGLPAIERNVYKFFVSERPLGKVVRYAGLIALDFGAGDRLASMCTV